MSVSPFGATSRRRLIWERVMITLCAGAFVMALLPLGWLLLEGVRVGGRHLSWDFLAAGAVLPGLGSWGSAVAGSAAVVGIAMALGVPLGVGTGVYMAEFGRGVLGRVTGVVCEALAGLPSILAGIAAYGLIMTTLGRFSVPAAGAALTVILVPMVALTTRDALEAVPREVREAARVLGLGETTTVLQVVMPVALARVVAGVLLASGRIVGETAPLLVTVFVMGGEGAGAGATLPTHIYAHATSPLPSWEGEAWAGALILVAAVIALHAVSAVIWRQRRRVPPRRFDRLPTGV